MPTLSSTAKLTSRLHDAESDLTACETQIARVKQQLDEAASCGSAGGLASLRSALQSMHYTLGTITAEIALIRARFDALGAEPGVRRPRKRKPPGRP